MQSRTTKGSCHCSGNGEQGLGLRKSCHNNRNMAEQQRAHTRPLKMEKRRKAGKRESGKAEQAMSKESKEENFPLLLLDADADADAAVVLCRRQKSNKQQQMQAAKQTSDRKTTHPQRPTAITMEMPPTTTHCHPHKHKQTGGGRTGRAMQLSLNDNIVQSNAYGKLRERRNE